MGGLEGCLLEPDLSLGGGNVKDKYAQVREYGYGRLIVTMVVLGRGES